MPVVGFSELRKHALDQQYTLAVVNVPTLAAATGILQCGNDLDAPVVLSVCGSELTSGIMPSLEAMARRAPIPVGLIATRIHNAEQATLGIRLGCNALVLAEGLSEAEGSEVRAIAGACGINVIEQHELSSSLLEIDQELATATLKAIAHEQGSWQAIEQRVAHAASDHLRAVFDKLGSSGRGSAALATCAPWRPVEHLIVYNTTTDDATSAELAAEGRRVLDRIPGVRATWSGCSVKADAGYRWCWLVRFAHPAVIDSYREHPDHVAYADNHFRPVAGDRISIDYELTGADETF
ncbi:MAG: Dabb family protein [Thiotrichales bacterium]|nr:MAG: Dabb family protein [Thiotrichales bacterium]